MRSQEPSDGATRVHATSWLWLPLLGALACAAPEVPDTPGPDASSPTAPASAAPDPRSGTRDASAVALDAGPQPPDGDADAVSEAGATSDAEAGASRKTGAVLIDHQYWQVYDPKLDPLRDHQPPEIHCTTGWVTDPLGPTLEVESGDCNYTLLAHPAQVGVEAGAVLSGQLWHFDLAAREPAEAHVVLLLGDELLWEARLSIPRKAGVLELRATAPRPIAKGELLRLHLHNHGENSYVLSTIRVGVSGG